MWVGPLLNSDCSEIPRRHKVFTIIRTERDTLQKGKGPFSSVQSLSCIRLFETPWTAARQVSCLSSTPGACSNSGPLSWWCHPIISSIVPFSSCLQSFPASGSFQGASSSLGPPQILPRGSRLRKYVAVNIGYLSWKRKDESDGGGQPPRWDPQHSSCVIRTEYHVENDWLV